MPEALLTPDAPAQLSAAPVARLAVPERKPPLPAMTGVRTLLAVNIMLFHFTPPHMQALAPIFDNGFVFVGFFFLIFQPPPVCVSVKTGAPCSTCAVAPTRKR